MKTNQERKPDFNRLRKVLLREGMPDVVPFYDLFADEVVISSFTGKDINYHSLIEFYYKLGYDYCPVWIDMEYGENRVLADDTAEVSKGQRIYADENHGIIENRDDYNKYVWPDPENWHFRLTPEGTGMDSGSYSSELVDKVGDELPEGMKLIISLKGIFESVTYLFSLVPMCFAIYDDPQLIADVSENVGKRHCEMIRLCLEKCNRDNIGAVALCEDMGYAQGTFLPPELMRQYAFPWMKKFVDIVHSYDIPLLMHACGNLTEVMDDLIDYVGIDAKQSYEDKIMPVTEIKKRWGDRIAVLGGIDIDFLCQATEDQVREHTRNVLKICMEGGGYALGTGNTIPNYVPFNNYLAMLDEGRKFQIG